MNKDYLIHYGVLGMKWGVRRYENKDGTLTPSGLRRYGDNGKVPSAKKEYKDAKRNNKISKKIDAQMKAAQKKG